LIQWENRLILSNIVQSGYLYNQRSMIVPLSIQRDVSLRAHNTFGIDAKASAYLRVTDTAQLLAVWNDSALSALPRLVLGGGSNIVFTRDFPGLILHMATQGIALVGEDAEATYVRAAAGESWDRLVSWTIERGLGGLENLSLIPGTVGAAPVQNIGAYGTEQSDFFHELTLFDFSSGKIRTLTKAECAFGYRDSIIKRTLRDRIVILDVTYALPKRWKPNVAYVDVTKELTTREITSPTAREISEAVIAIRTRKLPDTTKLGNAGSFFKNPVVTQKQKDELVARYPQLVSYEQDDGSYKLAAGWLVDQCGWKGKTSGMAGVSERQALVLVNRGSASGKEVLDLARSIQEDVIKRFGVQIDIEPVVI
jgi:UDP-N-acetylmuramate dehydrogenase